MIVKLLGVSKLNNHRIGGCRGSSESTLVKMPHCWKSHVTAHRLLLMSLTLCILGNFHALVVVC